jgi:hypothetical protein
MALLRRRARPAPVEPPLDPEAAEDFYLEILKHRVGWQATLAACTRAGETLEPLERGARKPAVDEAPTSPPPVERPVWTIERLDRIVAERETVDPEAARELSYYTYYLRNFAGEDGRLPDHFDRLLDEVFGAAA